MPVFLTSRDKTGVESTNIGVWSKLRPLSEAFADS